MQLAANSQCTRQRCDSRKKAVTTAGKKIANSRELNSILSQCVRRERSSVSEALKMQMTSTQVGLSPLISAAFGPAHSREERIMRQC